MRVTNISKLTKDVRRITNTNEFKKEKRRVTNTNELPYPQSPGSVGFLWGPIVTKRKTISW